MHEQRVPWNGREVRVDAVHTDAWRLLLSAKQQQQLEQLVRQRRLVGFVVYIVFVVFFVWLQHDRHVIWLGLGVCVYFLLFALYFILFYFH